MSDQYPPQYPGGNEPPYQPPMAPPSYAPPPPSYTPQEYAPPPSYAPQEYAPPGYAQPGYAQPGYAPTGVLPTTGTSGLATASMILGIVGMCTLGLTAIPAIICGHLGLSKIKQSNNMLQGRGMAIAGLVLGYLEIAAIVGWVVLFIIAAAASTATPQ